MKSLSFLTVFLFPIVFLSLTAEVKWAQNKRSLILQFEKQDPHILQCIKSGLEVRYRIEHKLCRRRMSWFDHCGEVRMMTRSVQYDPISESYRIVTDSLADDMPPMTVLETENGAALRRINRFPLDEFRSKSLEGLDLTTQNKLYLGVRIRGYCQREQQSLLTQIPYYLTLGLFRFTGFDTGWVDYNLK